MMRSTRQQVADPDDVDAAESVALRILGGASQSSHDLLARLERRGFSPQTAATAVERCRQLGYVDDSAFAAALAGRHTRHGHGAARVAAELRRRGVQRDVIEATLAGNQEETAGALEGTAAQLIERERRRGDLDDAAWRRVGGALQRRGFSASAIRRTLREMDVSGRG